MKVILYTDGGSLGNPGLGYGKWIQMVNNGRRNICRAVTARDIPN